MEEGVSDKKDGKKRRKNQEKEAEFPDETSLVEREEGVSGRKYYINAENMRKRGRIPR